MAQTIIGATSYRLWAGQRVAEALYEEEPGCSISQKF
jgi:hypothetical protein